jgi:hypothetical protein
MTLYIICLRHTVYHQHDKIVVSTIFSVNYKNIWNEKNLSKSIRESLDVTKVS